MKIIPNWHPLIVHFTIGLLLATAFLFVLAAASRGRSWGASATVAGRWNLALGVAAALATIATGWRAYNTVAHDGPSHANMTVHMWWALGATGIFIVAGILAWIDRRRAVGASALLLVALIAGSGTLAVTGWYGGENVYRFGLGVMSMPKADHHHHDDGAAGHRHDAGAADHDHAK